jgi:hypothetical protein
VSTFRGLTGALLALAVIASCILVPLVFLPNWDVDWFFELSQRLIEGERLYSDTIEVNFPWAIYLYLPAVYLANLIGGSPFIWLSCGVAIFVLLNLAIADRFLLDANDGGIGHRGFVLAGIVVILVVFPGAAFGQREHLAVILTLPYLMARLSGTSRPIESEFSVLAPLSLVAGVGFSLKPFFFFPWLVTQIAVTRKDWSPRNISLIVLTALPMAVQLVTIPILFPDLVKLYQSFGHEYAAYWRLPAHFILVYKLHLLAFALVLIAAAGLVQQSRKLLVQGLAWVSFAWFTTGIVQGKGWGYHFLPAQMTLILSGFFAVLCFNRSRRRSAAHLLLIACLCLLLAGDARIWSEMARSDYRTKRSQLPEEVAGLSGEMRAIVLSVRIRAAHPVLSKLGARNVGSFPFVWPLQVEYWQAGSPGQLVPVRHPEEMTEPESILFEAVVDDLIQKKPEIILVSDGTDEVFNDACFDEVAYFSQNEAFRKEMALYKRGPALDQVRIYVRADIGS